MSETAQHFHVFETAMGFCAIAWGDAGITRFQLPTKSAEATDRLMRRRAPSAEPGALPEDVAAVVEAAKRYFAGEEMDFASVRVDLAGQDAFFAQIYDALRQVGWGARPPMARWRRRSAPGAKERATSARRWPKIPCP